MLALKQNDRTFHPSNYRIFQCACLRNSGLVFSPILIMWRSQKTENFAVGYLSRRWKPIIPQQVWLIGTEYLPSRYRNQRKVPDSPPKQETAAGERYLSPNYEEKVFVVEGALSQVAQKTFFELVIYAPPASLLISSQFLIHRIPDTNLHICTVYVGIDLTPNELFHRSGIPACLAGRVRRGWFFEFGVGPNKQHTSH